jgi:hypothetical protein
METYVLLWEICLKTMEDLLQNKNKKWNWKITPTWTMESRKRIRARKSKNLIWIKKTRNWKRNGDSKNWKRKKTSWRETWIRKNWAWEIKRNWNFEIWKRKRTLKIKNRRRGS